MPAWMGLLVSLLGALVPLKSATGCQAAQAISKVSDS